MRKAAASLFFASVGGLQPAGDSRRFRITQPQLAWRTQDAIVAIGPATVFSPHQAGVGTLSMKRLWRR
jgi:hypothetical protein